MTDDAKGRILSRIRNAIEGREVPDHPGSFEGWRPAGAPGAASGGHLANFTTMFEAAGGEVVRVVDRDAAAVWMHTFCAKYDSVATGRGVSPALTPDLPLADPSVAPLGVSQARGAVAETGSLVMDARDGRRTQLLTPVHVVVVRASEVHASLRDAFVELATDLPAAIGLHSGPSKSADIGQVMVRGVHGPGRVVALIVEGE